MLSGWFKRVQRQARAQIWTDTQIDLYERQMAARAALGTKYICHPINDQPRKLFFQGQEIIFDGRGPLNVPAQEVLSETPWEMQRDGSLKYKLHLVK